jgi:hypothetical protein
MSQPEENARPIVTIGGQEVAWPAGDPAESNHNDQGSAALTVDLEPMFPAMPPYTPAPTTSSRNWTPLGVLIGVLSLIGLVTVLVTVWRLRAYMIHRRAS